MRKRLKSTTVVLFMALFVLALASCGGGGEKEAAEVETLDSGFKQVETMDMAFQWKVDGDTLEVILESPESGWVAAGFDPDSIMKGANFIIGYVQNGEPQVKDHWGNSPIKHSDDEELGGSNDVTVIEGSEDENGTMLHFSIPLDSGDEYDKPLTAGETYKVLLAYSPSDDFVTQHSEDSRGSVEIEL